MMQVGFISAGLHFCFVTLLAVLFSIHVPAANAQTQVQLPSSWKLNSKLTCEDRQGIINRLGAETKVDVVVQSVAAGQTFDISWSRGRFPEREPVYLMMSFDQPVRIKGKGLYGLMPKAGAAFRIDWQQENTRVVIPYYGRGVPKQGIVSVEPLLAGPVKLRWQVLGYDGCATAMAETGGGETTVRVETSGKPEIVVNDPDSFGKPKVTYVSPDGTRHLQIFEKRYRLIDVATGAEIANRVGVEAKFSPTGRFVTALIRDPAMEVVSAIDGKLEIKTPMPITNAWDNQDSMLYSALPSYGELFVYDMLTGRLLHSGQFGPRIMSGTFGTGLYADMENNTLSLAFSDKTPAAAISTGKAFEHSEIGRITAVTSPIRPEKWIFRSKPAVTRADQYTNEDGDGYDRYSDLVKFLIIQNDLAVRAEAAVASFDGSTQIASNTAWRNIGTGPLEQSGAGSLVTRLMAVGINVLTELPAEKFDGGIEVGRDIFYKWSDKPIHNVVNARIAKETTMDGNRFKKVEAPGCYDNYGESEHFSPRNFNAAWRWEHDSKIYWLTTAECEQGSLRLTTPTSVLYSSMMAGPASLLDDLKDPSPDNTEDNCNAYIDACGFELKVFGNRLVLFSEHARGFAIVDSDTGKVITKKFNLPRGDLFENVLLVEDGKHIVSIQKDGSFFLNRIDDNKTILSGRYADDEIVVWTDDRRFDSTAEGAHFVSFKFPGRIGEYSFQQFEGALRVPGLVEKVLSGAYQPQPVNITPPPALEASIGSADGFLNIDARASAFAPIKSLQVFQDGLLTDKLDVSSGQEIAEWSTKVSRLPGTRWTSVVATDETGVASRALGRDLGPQKGAKRRIHVLSVGIDKYDLSNDDAVGDLRYAVSDASVFMDALADANIGDAELGTSTKLLDNEASPDAIVDALKEIIANARPGETVAMFFAGHGVKGPDGKFYLATSKTNVDDFAGTALDFDRVSQVLREAKTRVVVFLDACHSGLAGRGLFTTNDEVAESVLQSVPSGIVVFSASKGRQVSLESEAAGGGFFANALATVIGHSRGKFDTNKNGAIEVSELFRGVKLNVVRTVRETRETEDVPDQTPWMARNRMVGDFALF